MMVGAVAGRMGFLGNGDSRDWVPHASAPPSSARPRGVVPGSDRRRRGVGSDSCNRGADPDDPARGLDHRGPRRRSAGPPYGDLTAERLPLQYEVVNIGTGGTSTGSWLPGHLCFPFCPEGGTYFGNLVEPSLPAEPT